MPRSAYLHARHLCPCGAQAKDWAYMHTDPDEMEGVTSKGARAWFSVKPEHYEPCHTKMDQPVHPTGSDT
jgi:hypothetical protein